MHPDQQPRSCDSTQAALCISCGQLP